MSISTTPCSNAVCANSPSSIPGLAITLRDERHEPFQEAKFHYEGGVSEFAIWLDRAKTSVLATPITSIGEAKEHGIRVEFALTWNDSYHETMLCFTNNITQRDGGTHLAGFRAALTRVVSKYAQGMSKKDNLRILRRGYARRPHRGVVRESA